MTVLLDYVRLMVALLSAVIELLSINIHTVTVELYSNPTSGYAWEYSFDNSGVLALTDTHYTPDAANILSGKGGGTRSFTFCSLNSGSVRVTFKYVKIIGTERIVASQYIYTYDVAQDGTISLRSIQ